MTPSDSSQDPPTKKKSFRERLRAILEWMRATPERMRANYRAHRPIILILCFFVLFLFIYLLPRMIIFIDAGQAGVLYRRFDGGVQTDITYLEGTHLVAPWNYMTIYDLRVNQVQFRFDILSVNGLTIGVDTSVRYQPKKEYLGSLHQKIGPEYVQRIVIPEAQAAIRKVFSRYTPQQIYQTQYTLPSEIRNAAATKLNDRFIVLDDLLIKSLELPVTVQAAIQSKLIAEQSSEEMKFRIERELKEKERLLIEGEGVKAYNDTVSQSLKGADSANLLQFKSIAAFLELAKSANSNTIVFGNPGNIPMLLPPLGQANSAAPASASAPPH